MTQTMVVFFYKDEAGGSLVKKADSWISEEWVSERRGLDFAQQIADPFHENLKKTVRPWITG